MAEAQGINPLVWIHLLILVGCGLACSEQARIHGAPSESAEPSGASVRTLGPEAALPDAGMTSQNAGNLGPELAGCRILPSDSPWNTDISKYPLSARSNSYVNAMDPSASLHPDFGTTWNGAPNGQPVLLVLANQERLPVTFLYAAQSDPGPYPIPLNAPIQGGPDSTGDRHVVVLETGTCTLYELYDAHPQQKGWLAGSGAIWHLNLNERRPDRWTSANAAGLPILPGLVRYDEVMEKKEILHALSATAASIQSAFIYPATHSDGTAGSDSTHPPMGTRLRLRTSFDTSGLAPPIQVLLTAMKKYGLIISDTGANWHIGGVPDSRWNDNLLVQGLAQVKGADFEVVDTGPVHPY